MRRFASCATLLLLMVLFAPASSRASTRAASCAQPGCVFLPIVLRPPPIAVADLWDTRARDGSVRFGGFVVATGSQPVYDAIIEATLYDGNDQLISTWTGTTVLTATLPGQENPF